MFINLSNDKHGASKIVIFINIPVSKYYSPAGFMIVRNICKNIWSRYLFNDSLNTF